MAFTYEISKPENDKSGVFGQCHVVGCDKRWTTAVEVVDENAQGESLYCDSHLEFHLHMHLRNTGLSRLHRGLSRDPVQIQ